MVPRPLLGRPAQEDEDDRRQDGRGRSHDDGRLHRVPPGKGRQGEAVAVEVAGAEIGGQILLGDAVDIVVHGRQQRGVAGAGDGDVGVLGLAGDETGDQGAPALIDVIFQGSPVGGGHIGFAALHRLDTALGVVAQDHGLVARGEDLLLQPPDQGDGDVPLVGGEALGGALGIGQGGRDDGGAVDEAQLGAQAGGQMHPHEHIIVPAEEHLPRALPVAAEGIFQIQPRLAGKIPEDGHQHAGGRALHAVGIGRGIFGAQHPEGAHAVQNALLAVAEDESVVDHAEIGIVKGILQVGVHLVDAGDGLVQGADKVGVPLGGVEIIGPGSELGHDPAVGDGGQGDAGDDVHRPLGQSNLLLVGGVVIDDLVGEIFRVQIGQDLAVAGLGLGPEAHPEGGPDCGDCSPAARRPGAEGGVHRAVAVLRELEELFRGGIFQQGAYQVHFPLPQVADGAPHGLVAIGAAIGDIFHLPPGVFRDLFQIIVVIAGHLAGKAEKAHPLLGEKGHPDGAAIGLGRGVRRGPCRGLRHHLCHAHCRQDAGKDPPDSFLISQ